MSHVEPEDKLAGSATYPSGEETDTTHSGPEGRQFAVEHTEHDSKASEQAKLQYLMSLILNFLDVPGQVLLIEGAPGTGKTSLALEILNLVENAHKVYASSRVSPAKLRQHFPWIDEVIDSMSGRTARASWLDELHDFRSTEPDGILAKILRLKHSRRKAVFVIDSWEGAARSTKEEARHMLESALLSELDESRVSIVIVTETEKHDHLDYLVDGIVSLSQSDLEGRRTRSLEIRKLRGFKVSTLRGLFTLDKGRFTLLPPGPDNGTNAASGLLVPVPHREKNYSSGIPDLDRILGGGLERGTLLLIDVDSNVNLHWLRPVLNIINANFINQGGSCFIVPSGGYSSENTAEALLPLVGETAMKDRVRIAAYSRSSSSKEWRVQMSGQLLDDVRTFTKAWGPTIANNPGSIVDINLDRMVAAYGEDLALPGFTQIGEGLRDAGALQICVSSLESRMRDDTLRNADYHLKIQNEGGSMLIYGVKPFTQAYAAKADFGSGYPQVALIPVV